MGKHRWLSLHTATMRVTPISLKVQERQEEGRILN